MRKITKVSLLLATLGFVPSMAFAQASITGVVRDSSGAVLPGVTVEATSPALIEQVRTAVTDGTGQYRIENLRPGTYTLTFALAGFNTVKREGLDLAGSFTATMNAELRVGALEETITVSGEAPTVDVQNTTRQRVSDEEVIKTLPTGRTHYTMAVLIPGVTSASGQDVGGSRGTASATLSVHGSIPTDQRVYINGLRWTSVGSFGAVSIALPNTSTVQEMVFDYSAISAEQAEGGVRINLIPKEGGNTFSGVFFASFANGAMQGNNFTQELKNRGLSTPDSLKANWDVNPGLGGPLKKDRLWFYTSVRHNGANNYVGGMFYNKNENNPNAWTYEPDLSRRASNDSYWKNAHLRTTWQISAKNKLSAFYDQQYICTCLATVSATLAPEAARYWYFPLERAVQVEWTSPLTNRILLEAAVNHHIERYIMDRVRNLNPLMINVVDQANGLMYRARDVYADNIAPTYPSRGAASYITGAHAVKVGFNHTAGEVDTINFDNQPISYRVNSQGGIPVPNQITMRATPYENKIRVNHDMGIFAQDRWTSRRLTLTLGVRYDYFGSSFPEQHLGPGLLVPTRELTFPRQANLGWKDINPKFGVSYDVFGDGKTAVRVTLNRYMVGQGATGGLGGSPNPINRLVLSTSRAWTDANRDFVPNCDLLNPAANGECGAMANANFGKQIPGATFDRDALVGWSHRPFNWEFSTGVQREIVPRVSVDVGYFRRWFGNFQVTDNLTVAASDYNPFSITAPRDPRLPDGGGYTVSGLYDLNPAKFGVPANNYVTLSDKYGKQINHWNGFDVTGNARLQSGVLFQGGISIGRTTTDNCEIVAKLDNPSQLYCHVQTPFLSQVKALASYTIPRIDLQLSGTFQSLPGPSITANYNAPNAVVAPSLGRNLSGNAANVTVNLVQPETMYGDRLNQLDLRVGKILRVGRSRTTVAVDLYNALNANPVLALNNSFAAWLRPTSILTARFLRLNAQVDF